MGILPSTRLRRKKVLIEQPEETQNNSGDTVQTWNPLATRKASVKEIAGKEVKFGDQIRADLTHKVWIRSDSVTVTINPKMRLTYNNRILNIEDAAVVGDRDQWILMMCKEHVI